MTTSAVADVMDIEIPLSTEGIVSKTSAFQPTPDVIEVECVCSASVTAFPLPPEIEMPAPPVVHGSSKDHQSD